MGYNKFPRNIAKFFLKKRQVLGLSEARFVTCGEEISKQTLLKYKIKTNSLISLRFITKRMFLAQLLQLLLMI